MAKGTWKEITPGIYIPQPKTAFSNKTGDWRTFRPVTDREKCINCGLCWLFCPDESRYAHPDGYYDSDLYHCKGCGICANECPTKAIEMVIETW